uniref:Zinc finger protein 830 n=1 Tax=Meloidogyne javanica TaxID=6303 RepID=A0A915M7M6_MELJA
MGSHLRSKVIKDLKNGNSYCNICSLQFKTKVLTAHLNSRKHREALAQSKEDSHTSIAAKRKLLDDNKSITIEDTSTSCPNKKSRTDQNATIGESAHNSKTEQPASHLYGEGKLIEGLPRGFFDDDGMNNRVRETVEKTKQINSELERFYKEVEEIEDQKDDEQATMYEHSTAANDIDLIDEQIERWKTINELEKRKESVIELASTKSEQTPNFDSVDDTESDFNFNSIDWRTKNL